MYVFVKKENARLSEAVGIRVIERVLKIFMQFVQMWMKEIMK